MRLKIKTVNCKFIYIYIYRKTTKVGPLFSCLLQLKCGICKFSGNFKFEHVRRTIRNVTISISHICYLYLAQNKDAK